MTDRSSPDIAELLRFHTGVERTFDEANDTVIVNRTLLNQAADEIERLRATPAASGGDAVATAVHRIEQDLRTYAAGLPDGDDIRSVLELAANDAASALRDVAAGSSEATSSAESACGNYSQASQHHNGDLQPGSAGASFPDVAAGAPSREDIARVIPQHVFMDCSFDECQEAERKTFLRCADAILALSSTEAPAQAAAPQEPVAWRSRTKGSITWQTHTDDPTDAISKYAIAGVAGYDIEPLYSAPRLLKRPIAWRCKDYADGWIIFQDEAEAQKYHAATDCLMQGMYVRDGSPVSSTESATTADEARQAMADCPYWHGKQSLSSIDPSAQAPTPFDRAIALLHWGTWYMTQAEHLVWRTRVEIFLSPLTSTDENRPLPSCPVCGGTCIAHSRPLQQSVESK